MQCPGRRCASGSCSAYGSCREETHAAVPLAASGIYPINAATSFDAYCDMTTDNGGWTLVGRSVVSATAVPFGWNSAAGRVDDDTTPYSLGVATTGMAFTQLLVGLYSTGKTVGVRAYRVDVQADFLTACASNGCPTSALKVITGTCSLGSVTMLGYAGWTSLTTHFFLRDVATNGVLGLRHNQFLLSAMCSPFSGELHTGQGMIFVR